MEDDLSVSEVPHFCSSDLPKEVLEKHSPYFPHSLVEAGDELKKGIRHALPRWEVGGAIYHICFRLFGTYLPRELLLLCEKHVDEVNEVYYMLDNKGEAIVEKLDEEHNALLRHDPKIYPPPDLFVNYPAACQCVKDCIEYNNGRNYILHAWCIMSNHLHILAHIAKGMRLSQVIQAWKSFISHKINKMLNRTGAVWTPTTFTHIIRNLDSYFEHVAYIWNNPKHIGISNWPWRWKMSDEQNDIWMDNIDLIHECRLITY